jgi:2Fe-2S ferredoxin
LTQINAPRAADRENVVPSLVRQQGKSMPQVTYVQHDGTTRQVDVPVGENVMRGALYNNIPGIEGECGGALSCATCRCYVDDAWAAKAGGPATHEERELIDAAEALDDVHGEERRNIRLSCQITMSADLDGLVVRLPEKQY